MKQKTYNAMNIKILKMLWLILSDEKGEGEGEGREMGSPVEEPVDHILEEKNDEVNYLCN